MREVTISAISIELLVVSVNFSRLKIAIFKVW